MRGVPLLVSAAMLVAGCGAPPTRVTLLPQADGSPSAVIVTRGQASAELTQPFTVALADRERVRTEATTEPMLRVNYPQLFTLQPAPARSYTLRFESGGTVLTAESALLLQEIILDMRNRSGGEIILIGHTDRVGTVEANDALSLRRAESVLTILVGRGAAPELVHAQGRGEREPQVPTADEIAEPLNRRVEVLVR